MALAGVGDVLGTGVGDALGDDVGACVGFVDGGAVGFSVGRAVGATTGDDALPEHATQRLPTANETASMRMSPNFKGTPFPPETARVPERAFTFPERESLCRVCACLVGVWLRRERLLLRRKRVPRAALTHEEP